MAAYSEIFDFFAGGQSPAVLNNVLVGCYVAAETVATESTTTPNHTNRLAWAKSVFENPSVAAQAMLRVLVAKNRALTIAQIVGATDTAIQTAINASIDVFATGP